MKYLIYIPIVCLSFGVAFGGGGLMQDKEGSEARLGEAGSSDKKVGDWLNDCTNDSDDCTETSTNNMVVTPYDSVDDGMTLGDGFE